MKYTVLVSVLAVFFICGLEARKLPSFIQKCKRNGPELNICMKKAMLDFRKYLRAGVNELKIATLDPYVLEKATVKLSWMTVIFTNLKLMNSYNYEIDYVDFDLDRNTISVNLTMDYMEIKSNYQMEGKLLQFPLEGSGEMESNFTNTRTATVIKGSKIIKNGKEYLQLTDIDHKFRRESLDYVYFHNLFPTNPELNERINGLFNENKHELGVELIPLIESIIGKLYLSFFQAVFDNFSLKELFV